jgi:nicotinate-nucleotide pyrophosphorylase (carboxylating)
MTTPASLLNPDAFLSPLAIDEAVHRALDEDLGRAGDITSMATIPETTQAHAVMIARQTGVIAGLPLAVATFRKRRHRRRRRARHDNLRTGARRAYG